METFWEQSVASGLWWSEIRGTLTYPSDQGFGARFRGEGRIQTRLCSRNRRIPDRFPKEAARKRILERNGPGVPGASAGLRVAPSTANARVSVIRPGFTS